MINKSLSQMNAERAARRAPTSGHKNFFWPTIPKRKKLQASSAIKKTQLTDRVKK